MLAVVLGAASAVPAATPSLSTSLLAALVGAIAPTLGAIAILVANVRRASAEDTPAWRRRALKAEKELEQVREREADAIGENHRLRLLLARHGVPDDLDAAAGR